MSKAFYRGANCCVLVFDVSSERSFENLDRWRREFIEEAGIKPEDLSSFPFVLLGNKVDIEKGRVINAEVASNWAQQNGMPYFEARYKSEKFKLVK